MDFRVTEDQEALRDGIRSFCEGRVPASALAGLEKNPLDRGLWSELAEMGVFGLRLPESEGGVGLGMAEAVLVFTELGRRLVPGPLIWTQLAASLVPGAESGDAVVTGLDRTRPTSEPILIETLEGADALLVIDAGGVRRVAVRELDVEPIETPLDPLTPLHRVAELPAGESLAGPEDAKRLRGEGAVLSAALLLGIAEETLETARAYALEREQFDRPIGSFQSIKHMLADMYVRQEQARAAVYAAAATADGRGAGELGPAISVAKLLAGELAHKNARACIQIHGGMGYTWEMSPHYYLKRGFVLENAFGTSEEHAEVVAGSVAP